MRECVYRCIYTQSPLPRMCKIYKHVYIPANTCTYPYTPKNLHTRIHNCIRMYISIHATTFTHMYTCTNSRMCKKNNVIKHFFPQSQENKKKEKRKKEKRGRETNKSVPGGCNSCRTHTHPLTSLGNIKKVQKIKKRKKRKKEKEGKEQTNQCLTDATHVVPIHVIPPIEPLFLVV